MKKVMKKMNKNKFASLKKAQPTPIKHQPKYHQCGCCRWFERKPKSPDGKDERTGVCHYVPPIIYVIDNKLTFIQPVTKVNNFCSMWETLLETDIEILEALDLKG